MGLRIAGKSDLLQCGGRAVLGFLEDLWPLCGVAVVELGVEPVEDLFGGIFDAFLETINRLLLSTGKEEACATKDLTNEFLNAQLFGILAW